MKKTYPLLDAIQSPLPIYKHCTLQEIICLGSVILSIILIVFPLLTALCCHTASIGLMLALPSSFVLTRVAIGRFARLKQDKPHGYAIQQLIKQGAALGLYRSPYITRCGRWSIGRR